MCLYSNIIHLASLKEMLDKPLLKCGNLCKITMSSRDIHEKGFSQIDEEILSRLQQDYHD